MWSGDYRPAVRLDLEATDASHRRVEHDFVVPERERMKAIHRGLRLRRAPWPGPRAIATVVRALHGGATPRHKRRARRGWCMASCASSGSTSTTCTWATCCARWPSIPTPRSPASSIRTARGCRRRSRSSPFRRTGCSPTSRPACRRTKADLAIVCSATAEHAEYVEKVAPHGLHILVEKPFAASVADARRMIAAMEGTGRRLAINWPLAWYPLAQHRQAADRRGRDRRSDRGALLRRQPRAALSSRRQGRGLAEEVERQKPTSLVVQEGARAAAACSTISATASRSAPGS